MNKIFKAVAGILGSIAIGGGLFISSQQDALLQKAVTMIEEKASESLGTQIKIGNIEVSELNFAKLKKSELILHDVEVFDKNSEHIAKVETTKIKLKILSLYDDGAGAVDEINIDSAHVNLKKRDDDSWNVNDIKTGEGESNFGALITVDNSDLTAEFNDKNIFVEEISATADCANINSIDTEVSAKVFDSHINAKGFVGAENQNIHANIDSVDVEKVLPFIPENTLPENVQIHGGKVSNAKIHVNHKNNILDYLGSAEIAEGKVSVENTEIENITGSATFNKSEVCFNASATANNQSANASGIIRLLDEVVFDVHADSENFSPAAIIPNIGIDGAANVIAHLTGTVKNPTVDAEIVSDYVAYENLSAQNLKTHLRYGNNVVTFTDLSADIFGGNVEGNIEVKTDDLSYTAHAKVYNLNVPQLTDIAGIDYDISGNIDGDIVANGIAADMDSLKVFGSAVAKNLGYQGFTVNNAVTSFYLDGNNLKIDNLKAIVPNRGSVGIDGEITDNNLNFNFYGAHIDLSIVKIFDNAIDCGGISDFTGSITGNTDNPNITLKLSAVDASKFNPRLKGSLFKQPFDSLKFNAAGSFDGINISDFEIEKGGQITWTLKQGIVGLTGDKKIDVELQTTKARVEDIVALVAPEQELTGYINNSVKITGTLNNPQVAGEVNFKYGSYRGVLISGMVGKYFVDDDKVRLQDFKITSPMVDAVLNGTIDRKSKAIDFVAQGNDLDLKRMQGKFPQNYLVSGHGKFEGLVTGTIDNPIFDGNLNADNLNFNGVNISNVHGHIGVNGDNIVVDEFEFNQGDGSYKVFMSGNTATKNLNGNVEVSNVDIPELFLLAGGKAKLLSGKLNSNISIGGNLANPIVSLNGDISKGAIVGYDLHDVNVELSFLNQILYVNKFSGKQGEGEFNISGTGGFNTPLDLKLTSKNIDLGIFPKLASSDMEVTGKANVDAKVGGSIVNPTAEAILSASGSAGGAIFDSITSHMSFKDWVCEIKDFKILRMIGSQEVSANASGKLPVAAFYIDNENVLPNEQFDLDISLDGADLSLLPVLNENVAWAVGETQGKLKITGTANNPKVDGKIGVNDGTIKFKGVDSMVENINISMLFNGNRFDVEKFVGNVGEGKLNLEGGFNFANMNFSDYNFNLKADALDVKSDVFTGAINAEFTLNEGTTPHGRILPKIAGHLDLAHCTIGLPSIPDSDEPLPEFLLDVSVNLGERVHLYRTRLFDMFLKGSANFEGTTLFPKSNGLITVRRGGTVTYLQNIFDIKEGEAHFNQLGSFFPSLKFSAETKLTHTTIFLNIEGSLNNMEMRLTSNPPMSETEIMQVLTFRDAYDSGKSVGLADALSIGLQMSVIGEIEDTIKRTLGLDRFILTSGSGSAFDRHTREEDNKGNEFNLSVGKYISDKVMLRYTQGINGKKISRYGIQYDVNDNISITAEHESGEFIFGFEARYSW